MATSRPKPALKPSLRAAAEAVARALTHLPAPGMLIGRIAVIARGVPQTTRDVDATVTADGGDLGTLVRVFERHELPSRIEDWKNLSEPPSSNG